MTPSIGEAILEARVSIERRPNSDAAAEARQLLEAITGLSKTEQIAMDDAPLSREQADALRSALARRAGGEPLARIIGTAAFWDFDVRLNDDTLVPRDDTGRLVEAALDQIALGGAPHVADLGTGSGIILIALARERPNLTGLGIDIAAGAVEQAARNAHAAGVGDRLRFTQGDWLTGVDERFDLIVSNPPYIAQREMAGLQTEVREHDPSRALLAGTDGLDAYRTLLPQAHRATRPGGAVLVEIGWSQTEAVMRLGKRAGLQPEEVLKDLAGNDRVCVFRRP